MSILFADISMYLWEVDRVEVIDDDDGNMIRINLHRQGQDHGLSIGLWKRGTTNRDPRIDIADTLGEWHQHGLQVCDEHAGDIELDSLAELADTDP